MVLQVLSTLLQGMCQPAMKQTSPLLAGPSPYGVLSTPGSPSWSYTSPHMCSEGTVSATLCCSYFYGFIVSLMCASVNRSWAQCLLPYAFYVCWLVNMVMNIIWLLLWDREYVFCVCLLLQPQKHLVWWLGNEKVGVKTLYLSCPC